MKSKIYTIRELIDTGLPIYDSCRGGQFRELGINKPYLQSRVISQWDFKDYSKQFTFIDEQGIRHAVYIKWCKTERSGRSIPLDKDLQNLANLSEQIDER